MYSNTETPLLIENAHIIDPSQNMDAYGSVLIENGKISAIGSVPPGKMPANVERLNAEGLTLTPGLIDMRVFVGEPGFEHRETFKSATRAAAAGGVTTIVTMPDTDPVIDDRTLVDFVQRRARDTGIVRVMPAAALTKGLKGEEMTEFGLLKQAGAIAFTDGRKSVMNAQVLRRALTYGRDFGALIMHHVEDRDLVGDGVMNEGETATRLGLKGIPTEAETIMLERDMRLVSLTGGRYHAAQISCEHSVDVMRHAKSNGLPVTCGVSINHLSLNEMDIGFYRTFFKLSPPLRAENDRLACVDGLADGTIDVIVSAHDPQHVETKRHPFAEAEDGAVGLETMLAVALRLHHNGDVPLLTLIRAMSTRPAEILGLPLGTLKVGAPADLILIDIEKPWVVEEARLRSRSKNTPFEAAKLQGRVMLTFVGGNLVYKFEE